LTGALGLNPGPSLSWTVLVMCPRVSSGVRDGPPELTRLFLTLGLGHPRTNCQRTHQDEVCGLGGTECGRPAREISIPTMLVVGANGRDGSDDRGLYHDRDGLIRVEEPHPRRGISEIPSGSSKGCLVGGPGFEPGPEIYALSSAEGFRCLSSFR
jgi:hypothetical protein